MYRKEIELWIDRVEEGYAVAMDLTGKEYKVLTRSLPLRENDVIVATVNENDEVVSARKEPTRMKEYYDEASELLKKLLGQEDKS
ncbi:MAG: hypothetical protein IJU41_07000 [Clostridia bacterium]|nr:hypothetical protein [Clostridia bacterium]